MKLNFFEKLIMNSPIRSMKQRKEVELMLQLGNDVQVEQALEIGCGRGMGVKNIFNIFNPLHVEAFDFDPAQVTLAKQRLSTEYGDKVKIYEGSATKIPCKDNQFDAVFDFGVLHHIPDKSNAIKEIARVLKPGGQFFFMEVFSTLTMKPIMRFLTKHPPQAQFVWEELLLKLEKAGLVVSEKSKVVTSTRVVGVAYNNS